MASLQALLLLNNNKVSGLNCNNINNNNSERDGEEAPKLLLNGRDKPHIPSVRPSSSPADEHVSETLAEALGGQSATIYAGNEALNHQQLQCRCTESDGIGDVEEEEGQDDG